MKNQRGEVTLILTLISLGLITATLGVEMGTRRVKSRASQLNEYTCGFEAIVLDKVQVAPGETLNIGLRRQAGTSLSFSRLTYRFEGERPGVGWEKLHNVPMTICSSSAAERSGNCINENRDVQYTIPYGWWAREYPFIQAKLFVQCELKENGSMQSLSTDLTIKSEPSAPAPRTENGDFEFDLPAKIEACEETSIPSRIRNIRNQPERGDPQDAKNVRIWLTPKDYFNKPENVGSVDPNWIGTMPYNQWFNITLTIKPAQFTYPLKPGDEKELYIWADGAFSLSHHDRVPFKIWCPGVTITPTLTLTPGATTTPTPTVTPTLCLYDADAYICVDNNSNGECESNELIVQSGFSSNYVIYDPVTKAEITSGTSTFNGGTINFHTTNLTENQRGKQASVALNLISDWQITGSFCKGLGCPSNAGQVVAKLDGFSVNCGTDVDYGWILKQSVSPTGKSFQLDWVINDEGKCWVAWADSSCNLRGHEGGGGDGYNCSQGDGSDHNTTFTNTSSQTVSTSCDRYLCQNCAAHKDGVHVQCQTWDGRLGKISLAPGCSATCGWDGISNIDCSLNQPTPTTPPGQPTLTSTPNSTVTPTTRPGQATATPTSRPGTPTPTPQCNFRDERECKLNCGSCILDGNCWICSTVPTITPAPVCSPGWSNYGSNCATACSRTCVGSCCPPLSTATPTLKPNQPTATSTPTPILGDAGTCTATHVGMGCTSLIDNCNLDFYCDFDFDNNPANGCDARCEPIGGTGLAPASYDQEVNGVINARDYFIVIANYGKEGERGDINGDGKVNAKDLSFLYPFMGRRVLQTTPAQ